MSDGFETIKAIVGIVTNEREGAIELGLARVVRCLQRIDSVITMNIGRIPSSEGVSTVMKVIVMVHVGWTFEMSPDMQAEKIFRGKGSFNIRDAGTSIEWRDNNAPYLGLSENHSSPFLYLLTQYHASNMHVVECSPNWLRPFP